MVDHVFKYCDQHSMFSPTCDKCVAVEHARTFRDSHVDGTSQYDEDSEPIVDQYSIEFESVEEQS